MMAIDQLIELAERLVPTGEIGDGTVAQFHDLAARARAERGNIVRDSVHIQQPHPYGRVQFFDGGRCRHCGQPR